MSQQPALLTELLASLNDNQAIDITVCDVRQQTTITDYMIICSGRSSRHAQALAEHVATKMKSLGLPSLSQNGLLAGEWILIDFGDFVLHIMDASTRAFYNLEGLWQDPH